jgi:hypothetical protein
MIRRLCLSAVAVAGVLAMAAPSAQAGLLVSSATGCDSPAWEQPFLPWLDVANYVTAPDGGLEAGAAGWTLLGGAATVAGNEPFFASGRSADARSLSLPAGSSATSAAMCVGIEHPTLRFFVRRDGGSFLSTLRVEVLFEDSLGNARSAPVGVVGADSSWSPTPIMLISASLLPLLPGDHTAVAFRFTPEGSGDWQVDDVYVDPYTRT